MSIFKNVIQKKSVNSVSQTVFWVLAKSQTLYRLSHLSFFLDDK
jgi:hypothetical protein